MPDNDSFTAAQSNWARYLYGRTRGHATYVQESKKAERFYLGAGKQWDDYDRSKVESEGRPASEQNEILPAINAAVGYQIANRMDVSLLPRGRGATDQSAATLSKVVRQILDENQFHWRETDVFSGGLIQRRGYYDIRMSYDNNILGDISIEVLDPVDVIPDPDASSYDPDKWADVLVTRWYTLDEIEQLYGKEAKEAVRYTYDASQTDGAEEEPSRFGTEGTQFDYQDATYSDIDTKRYRIIDRQIRVYEMSDVLIYPDTMEVRLIAGMDDNQVQEEIAIGAIKSRRMMRKVKWIVSTSMVTLFNKDSPYPWFTIVPYFCIFRRGRTVGWVDNAISPQETLNKSLSQLLHAVNGSANSGWQLEENQLVNLSDDELKEQGGLNGLILVRKQGTPALEKIRPNPVPAGIEMMVERSYQAIQNVTGINESLKGNDDIGQMSGIAIQSRQYAAQQGLAIPLDSLARTRFMLAKRVIDLIQRYMEAPRVLRISDSSPDDTTTDLQVNMPQANGSILNDLTKGEYDIVISEQPMAVTFENTQFEQAITMIKDAQVPIPPARLVRYSNLADKAEIARELDSQQEVRDPLAEAQAEKIKAETEKIRAESVAKSVEGMYSAVRSANEISLVPHLAGAADTMLRSAGFEDKDQPPIIPNIAGMLPGTLQGENTNPLTPPNPVPESGVPAIDEFTSPAVGLNEGIEGGGRQTNSPLPLEDQSYG